MCLRLHSCGADEGVSSICDIWIAAPNDQGHKDNLLIANRARVCQYDRTTLGWTAKVER